MRTWLILAAVVAVIVVTMAGRWAADARVVRVAEAIATAEGFYAPGSRPQRSNNPGALFTVAGEWRVFRYLADGWRALYRQVSLMLYGGSRIYAPSMPIWRVAELYVGTDPRDDPANWARIVAGKLGVSVDTPIGEAV